MLWETGRREQSPGNKFRLDGTAGPSTVLGRKLVRSSEAAAENSAGYWPRPLPRRAIRYLLPLSHSVIPDYRNTISRYSRIIV